MRKPQTLDIISALSRAQPQYNLGNVLAKQGRWSEAIAAYRGALKVAPHYKIHLKLAEALQQQGEIDEAIDRYRKTIELQPDLKEVYQKLGDLLHRQGRLEEAKACYRGFQQSNLASGNGFKAPAAPQSSNYLKQAQSSYDRQQWQEAIDLCQKALELDPESAEAYSWLGHARYAKRELEEAKEAYLQATALNPKLAPARANLGSIYLEEGEFELAIACYREAVKLEPKQPLVYSNWGQLHLQLDQYEEAAACYRKAMELDPELIKAYEGLGKALSQQQKWDEAAECYRQLLHRQPTSVPVQAKLAKALHHQSLACLEESIRLYSQAIAVKPYEVDLYHGALETNPHNARLYLGLGKALESQGETAQAIVFYNLALQQDPQRWEDAIAAYSRLMQQDPDSPALRRKLSEAYGNVGQVCLQKALSSYQQALELDPSNPQLYYEALEANRSNAQWYFGLAKALWQQGERQGAIALYRKGLKLDPDNAEASASLKALLEVDESALSPKTIYRSKQSAVQLEADEGTAQSHAEFDWTFYVEAYDDLSHLSSAEEAYQHWIDRGQKEGRVASAAQFDTVYGCKISELPSDFKWQDYLELNPDLKASITSKLEAIHHFLLHGVKEGRLYSFKQLYYQSPPLSTDRKPTILFEPKDSNLESNFDWKFYLEYNEDLSVLSSEQEAREHWFNCGRIEGRIASQEQFYAAHGFQRSNLPLDFDWQGYLELHLDLKANITSKWKAIEHYMTIGQREKRIYSLDQLHKGSQVAEQSRVQILNPPINSSTQRLGVLFHLYYFDLWDEIRGYIQNIEEEFDFYVNIVESIWTPEIHDRIRQDFPHARIQVSQNRGKDIGGHLASMELIDCSQYDVLGLIHTKKSPHVSHLISNQWRKDLFEAILGTPEKVKTNLEIMRTDASVGAIGSRYWRNTDVLNNAEHYDRLLEVFEIKSEARKCEYISGTMMFVRPQIIKTLYDRFQNADLEQGDGKDLDFQKDGQIAHALERILGNLVRHQGMRLFWQE